MSLDESAIWSEWEKSVERTDTKGVKIQEEIRSYIESMGFDTLKKMMNDAGDNKFIEVSFPITQEPEMNKTNYRGTLTTNSFGEDSLSVLSIHGPMKEVLSKTEFDKRIIRVLQLKDYSKS